MSELEVSKSLRGERARIEALVAKMEASVRRAFRQFLDAVQSAAVRRQVRIALEQQGVDAALRIVDSHVARLGAVIPRVFQAVGTAEVEALARQLRAGAAHIAVSFDPSYPRAAEAMQRNRLEFVQEFTQAQRASTRAALTEALQSGAGPIQVAREFRDSIGLTAAQRAAVISYRRALERGDIAALDRDLRDRRFDASVRRAAAGEPLGAKKIQRMVDQYRQRYLQYRAENIARTETLKSLNGARDEATRQVLEQTGIDSGAVEQTWRATNDERTRDTHRAMDGQVARLNEPFTSPSGAQLRFPGDASLGAPASELINCRCVLVTRIKF